MKRVSRKACSAKEIHAISIIQEVSVIYANFNLIFIVGAQINFIFYSLRDYSVALQTNVRQYSTISLFNELCLVFETCSLTDFDFESGI